MYLTVDAKGRVLIPSKIRKRFGFGRRVRADAEKKTLVIYASEAKDYVERYAGILGSKMDSPEEFERAVQRQMKKEIHGLLETIPKRLKKKNGLH